MPKEHTLTLKPGDQNACIPEIQHTGCSSNQPAPNFIVNLLQSYVSLKCVDFML